MAQNRDDYFGNAPKDMISHMVVRPASARFLVRIASYTIVLAPKGLDRFSFTIRAGNDTFGCGDVDFEKWGEASHFTPLSYPPH